MRYLKIILLVVIAGLVSCEEKENAFVMEAGKSVENDQFSEEEIKTLDTYGMSLEKRDPKLDKKIKISKTDIKERNCVAKIGIYNRIYTKGAVCSFVEKYPRILRGDCGAHFVDSCRLAKKKVKKTIKKKIKKKKVKVKKEAEFVP